MHWHAAATPGTGGVTDVMCFIAGLLCYPLTCEKCSKKRTERKEIITEFVDTEFKYGRDLRIIRDEFLRPMEVAGLLSKEQLKSIFLNIEELIRVNVKFAERLQDALDIATEQGDEVRNHRLCDKYVQTLLIFGIDNLGVHYG